MLHLSHVMNGLARRKDIRCQPENRKLIYLYVLGGGIFQGHSPTTSLSRHERMNREVDKVASELLEKTRSSIELSSLYHPTAPRPSLPAKDDTSATTQAAASAPNHNTGLPCESLMKEYCQRVGWASPMVSSCTVLGHHTLWRCTVTVSTKQQPVIVHRESSRKKEARRLAFADLLRRVLPDVHSNKHKDYKCAIERIANTHTTFPPNDGHAAALTP